MWQGEGQKDGANHPEAQIWPEVPVCAGTKYWPRRAPPAAWSGRKEAELDTIRDKRGFKFGKLPTQVLYSKKLSSNAKVIYAALDKFAGNDTQKCFPGQRRVSDLTGMSLSSVNRAVLELSEARFIRVEKKTSRHGLRNEYVLLPLR